MDKNKKIYLILSISFFIILFLNILFLSICIYKPNGNKTLFLKLPLYKDFILESGVLITDAELKINNHILTFKKDTRIYFYKSKNIKLGTLLYPVYINNYNTKIPIGGINTNYYHVYFYEDGNVEQSIVSENLDLKIRNNIFKIKIRDFIIFYNNKNIKTIYLHNSATFYVNKTEYKLLKEKDEYGYIQVDFDEQNSNIKRIEYNEKMKLITNNKNIIINEIKDDGISEIRYYINF